jgi:hypothetical protein
MPPSLPGACHFTSSRLEYQYGEASSPGGRVPLLPPATIRQLEAVDGTLSFVAGSAGEGSTDKDTIGEFLLARGFMLVENVTSGDLVDTYIKYRDKREKASNHRAVVRATLKPGL